MFFNNIESEDIFENSYKDELIESLKQEIENLKGQLKFEKEISDGILLTNGEYVVGEDLKPGRYSFKLVYGNDGCLETTGRNWVIETLGDKWNGISEYHNLSLKIGQKLKISGDVKLLLTEENPLNISEDISVIHEKDNEINHLKDELSKVRKEFAEYKQQFNNQYIEDNLRMTCGEYRGGENIKTGYYDLEVISGSGTLDVRRKNLYIKIGIKPDEIKYYTGLRITDKMKIEITGTVLIKAIRKNIQRL